MSNSSERLVEAVYDRCMNNVAKEKKRAMSGEGVEICLRGF